MAYKGLHGPIRGDRIIRRYSKYCSYTVGYKGLQGVIGGVTRGYRGLQGVTWGYWGLRGLQEVIRGQRGLQRVTAFSQRKNELEI